MKFNFFWKASFKLTADNNAVYANSDAAETKANGHQIKASSKGTIKESKNSRGMKCLKDSDENVLV